MPIFRCQLLSVKKVTSIFQQLQHFSKIGVNVPSNVENNISKELRDSSTYIASRPKNSNRQCIRQPLHPHSFYNLGVTSHQILKFNIFRRIFFFARQITISSAKTVQTAMQKLTFCFFAKKVDEFCESQKHAILKI